MLFGRKMAQTDTRGDSLEAHLQQEMQQESPVLLAVVRSFRELDQLARRLGFFSHSESYTRNVPWWPIIAVLGTYSAGKSTFLNDYLDYPLQLSGNQAVDDKFTVICFGKDSQVRALPALALDADPRFPFYKMSKEINVSAAGEGGRMDAYLQLKTCPSEIARGRIFIDSPGFDADEQRTAVLRITDHIVDLSDIVLVFFDARHPESGSMRDTLEHLVEKTVKRSDTNKFLYVLNHLDATAQDDNAEQVVAAWQRGLAQKGLTAGRFYHIYSRSAATPIADPQVRARYEAMRETDYTEIDTRIQQIRVGQAYRIVGALERSATELEQHVIPQLRGLLHNWRTQVLRRDGLLFGAGIVVIGLLSWIGLGELLGEMVLGLWGWVIGLGCVGGAFAYVHWQVRGRVRAKVIAAFCQNYMDQHSHNGGNPQPEHVENIVSAFMRSTSWYRSIFQKEPAAWNARARALIEKIQAETESYVQQLNDMYTNPSGAAESQAPKEPHVRELPTEAVSGSQTAQSGK